MSPEEQYILERSEQLCRERERESSRRDGHRLELKGIDRGGKTKTCRTASSDVDFGDCNAAIVTEAALTTVDNVRAAARSLFHLVPGLKATIRAMDEGRRSDIVTRTSQSQCP